MQRLIFALAVVAMVAGCQSVQMVRWQPRRGIGTVSAGLCSICTDPSPVQKQAAEDKARAICHGPYLVTDEGVTANGSVTYAAPTGAGGYLMGSTPMSVYYWTFECTR